MKTNHPSILLSVRREFLANIYSVMIIFNYGLQKLPRVHYADSGYSKNI